MELPDLSMFYTVDPETGEPVELPRPETKSFDDVKQCIFHHCGCNDAVVELFVGMLLLGQQWDWFDLYKEWLATCEAIQDWNDNREPDEDGNLPDERPLPPMPERPEQIMVEQWKLEHFALLREAAYGSYQTQFDISYHSDDAWREMQDSIREQYPMP